MERSKTGERRNAILLGLALVAVLTIVAFGLKSLMAGSTGKPKAPPKISLLPTTPPPPPPPPKEEKKPEPPKEQKEVKMEQRDEPKAAPPADPALKMEGAAGDGPSAFASGKVSSEDLSRIGSGGGGGLGGGGGGGSFASYANAIKSELQRHLAKRSELRRRPYRIELRVWVAEDGRLKHFELIGTTDDGDTDAAINSVLAAMPSFSEPPPPKMPQPVRLRIVTSGRG